MSDNEQQMVLVAKLVDQTSDKLREINKAMLATEAAAKKAHASGTEAADKHRKAVELLQTSYEQIREATTELIKPGFAALGVGAISLAGAIGAVVDAVKNLGEEGLAIEKVHNRTGMLANSIREVQGLGERWGISIDQTNEGLSEFGDMLSRTNRLAPDAMRQWMAMPGAFELLGSKLRGLDTKHAFDKTMDFVVNMKNADQKRRLLAMLGLPADLANFTKETLAEARVAEAEYTKNHPGAAGIAARADESFTKLRRSFQGLRDDLGAAFGGPVLEGVEAINHFLENHDNVEAMGKAFHGVAEGVREFVDEARKGEGPLGVLLDAVRGAQNLNTILNHDVLGKKSLRDELDDNKNARPGTFNERWNRLGIDQWGGLPNLWRTPGMEAPRPKSDLYKPTSFEGFSQSDTSRYVEDPMYRGMLRALQEWSANMTGGGAGGAGSGGGYTNANYNPGGGGVGGGGGGGGLHNGGGYKVIPDSLGGGGGSDGGGPSGPSVGTLAEQRKRFAEEMKRVPGLRDKIMRIMANEQGKNPNGTQSVVESMMNRAIVRHTSLEKQARWYGGERGGYYAMGNMGRGALENEKWRAILNHGVDNALGGSNVSDYATDNSSGNLAARERASGKFRFRKGYHGESFFSPGWGEPKFARSWDSWHRDVQLAEQKRATDGKLLSQNNALSNGKPLTGSANISVDFNNIPRGAKTAATYEGMFRQMKVNRGFAMPQASDSD